MKRRDFLQEAGLLAAGATNVLATCGASEAADSEVRSRRSAADAAIKEVLVTSAHSELARVIAAKLKVDYQVRLTAPVHVEALCEFVKSALNHDELTNLAIRGVDAIVHVAEPLPDVNHAEGIDYRTRCTYNLLQAAVKEGVQSIVYLSSLRIMGGYNESFRVDEDWRPLPTPASGGLSDYLGEFTCREFAREGKLNVIALRLGNVASAEPLGEEASNSAWVDPRDVAQAISCALTKLLGDWTAIGGHWSVFHVLSHSPSCRFPIRKARRILGYRPDFGGQES
jgi:NAD(P)-dependent dehydrogenase (short-subunit alcohol dehydrogenase family)